MIRNKNNRMSAEQIVRIATHICQLAGVGLEKCWVHGSQSPSGRQTPKPYSDLDLYMVVEKPESDGPWGGNIRKGTHKVPRMVSLNIEGKRVEVSLITHKDTGFRGSKRVINIANLSGEMTTR